LALTSPTSGGRSVGIVRLRTKATGFSFLYQEWISVVLSEYLRVHINKMVAICSRLYSSYWFRDQESSTRAVHTMPLFLKQKDIRTPLALRNVRGIVNYAINFSCSIRLVCLYAVRHSE
jgi:hypothetical protein